ncbi:MAG: class I SAM-dependent methyltransferase [Zoogloeaceae bacterium]|nr:class I SAM-dependent methyltransferase [Rhodocyclaceae bacterium]MCP5237227.1 class I SAM-dependent methyltransferase [Zoogloeaceae bacterium]
MSAGIGSLLKSQLDIFVNPATGAALRLDGEELVDVDGGLRFPAPDGIPNLYVETDAPTATGFSVNQVSDTVKSFYEETPFPNYDDVDSRQSLTEKAGRGHYARALDEQLPPGSLIWEAGCGTGQLSNFLGMSWRRSVIGGDLCRNSLRLAKDFAERNVIRNVGFVQLNLFNPPFRNEVFDVVISNGVLHHTADCELAFRSILAKLKPGGHILIGLYNRYGRLPTLWKRRLFDLIGRPHHLLDRRLRNPDMNAARVRAWYMDQYRHPHETRHSMDEVLQWFDRHGVEFVNGIPRLDGRPFAPKAPLFEPQSPGSTIDRVATQLEMLLAGGQDGGLFIMIGRKKAATTRPPTVQDK